MKRAKQARSTVTTLSRARTGRDGAVDFALKMRDVADEVAQADHVYRVIEIVGHPPTASRLRSMPGSTALTARCAICVGSR